MEKLVKVTKSKRKILENLIQIYLHDISLSFPIDFDSRKGIYIYDNIDQYFENDKKQAYFLYSNEDIVGFTLIDNEEQNYLVQEFFIMNNYKRKGLGKKFAHMVFDKYHSDWVIKVVPNSKDAEIFWEKVIKEYTQNKYTKELIGKFNRAKFEFENK